ncbi:dapper homolog 3 [Chanos chanos]|uniref:Dapper homolog 3 n=1 Tax=Chanos chanos TaxID=29144 RepID=A0A6J2WUW7_CHACN|nr:dapper homolog 3-like [Chanos chanos]
MGTRRSLAKTEDTVIPRKGLSAMHRAFSFPMTAERSRNKERLEASLAGLFELELLKQRQECLVLNALSLGDTVPGRPAWGDLQPPRSPPNAPNRGQDDLTLRRQLCTPWGLMSSLEQQVGELRVDAESASVEPPTDVEDSRPSSGFYELSEGQSPVGLSDSSGFVDISPCNARAIRLAYANDRPKSVGDVFVANREGSLESGARSMVPRSFSAPYPSLEGIAEGVGEDESWPWDPSDVSGVEGEPTAEDYRQAHRVESYILGLIQRRSLPVRPSKPRTSLGPEVRGVVRQSSLCRKEPPFTQEHRNASPNPEGSTWASTSLDEEHYSSMAHAHEDQLSVRYPRPRQAVMAGIRSASLDFPCGGPADPSGSEADSPQRFQSYPTPHSPSSDEQLVNAQYIPAQPCHAPTRATTHRSQAPLKCSRNTYSPERAPPKPRVMSKKCRFTEERAAGKKPGRKACRSQSENSLLGQRGVSERKYNTVERDGVRPSQPKAKRPPAGTTGYRRWRSTLELSQDEAEPPAEQSSRRSRKPRPAPPPYTYVQGPAHHPHHHHHHHHTPHHQADYLERAPICRPEDGYGHPPPGDSESSLSEADSPGSSSLSSDSDESGGLVWPQQLPPQLASQSPSAPSGAPLQPKAFVKIKASHALKKKILRFRTGSLKVMTTV